MIIFHISFISLYISSLQYKKLVKIYRHCFSIYEICLSDCDYDNIIFYLIT